jgi:hypothetical protein
VILEWKSGRGGKEERAGSHGRSHEDQNVAKIELRKNGFLDLHIRYPKTESNPINYIGMVLFFQARVDSDNIYISSALNSLIPMRKMLEKIKHNQKCWFGPDLR